jgi:hypothetical protein
MYIHVLRTLFRNRHFYYKKDVVIVLNLQNHVKTLQENTIISPQNINSAITISTVDGKYVYLYRKDEWEKVLLHELMHVFCLDQHQIDMHTDIIAKFILKFNIESHIPFRFSEAITEAMTSIIYVVLFTVHETVHNRTEKMLIVINRNFKNTMKNFIKASALTFAMFKKDNENIDNIVIKQSTHAFEYIIAKAALFYDINQFIKMYIQKDSYGIVHRLTRVLTDHKYRALIQTELANMTPLPKTSKFYFIGPLHMSNLMATVIRKTKITQS